MLDIISSASEYSPVIEPIYKEIVNTVLKHHLSKLSVWMQTKRIDNEVAENYFESKFEAYLKRTYEFHSYVNTLVFPNQRVTIKSIYEPLTLVSTRTNSFWVIGDKFTKQLLKLNKRIIISDLAGMGKSTIAKWVTVNIIKDSHSIPILIELRKINENHSILDEIFHQIDSIDKKFDKDLILRFLELGSFTIIFDGLDEISQQYNEFAIKDIRSIINKAGENRFIITSRPEESLVSFGDFQSFRIQPLQENQAYSILKNYDSLNEIKYAEKLFSEISERMYQVKEFLTNPFLVSLLYKSYTYNKDIPNKKSAFYDEVYTALFKNHDSSKDGFKRPKASGLDILDFRIILRRIAFESMKLGKIEYTESELIRSIQNAKTRATHIPFKEVLYVEDLVKNVPLFNKEGNQIKWAHKSIQDYFAAEYIVNSPRGEEILKNIYLSKNDSYLNVIDLIFELDVKFFNRSFVKLILEEFVDHVSGSYRNFENIESVDLEIRRSLTFQNQISFLLSSNDRNDLAKEKTNGLGKVEHAQVAHFSKISKESRSVEPILSTSDSFTNKIFTILSIKAIDVFDNSAESYIKKSTETIGDLVQAFTIDKPYIISEEVEAEFNVSINFGRINRLLLLGLHKRTRKYLVLDIDKSKKYLLKIYAEVALENSSTDLHGF